jgi:hypothetical protein
MAQKITPHETLILIGFQEKIFFGPKKNLWARF